MTEEHTESGFDSPSWWRYPPLRNAFGAGQIAGRGFVLAHLGLIAEAVENVFYWITIPLGGWYWAPKGREADRKAGSRHQGLHHTVGDHHAAAPANRRARRQNAIACPSHVGRGAACGLS